MKKLCVGYISCSSNTVYPPMLTVYFQWKQYYTSIPEHSTDLEVAFFPLTSNQCMPRFHMLFIFKLLKHKMILAFLTFFFHFWHYNPPDAVLSIIFIHMTE